MGLAATSRRPRQLQTATWPASTLGLAANSPALSPDPRQASRLENFFPTPEGIRLRAGMALHSTMPTIGGTDIEQLMPLDTTATDYLLAAAAATLWDATSDADPPLLLLTGLASGDWSWQQFATTGGVFGIGVNAVDKAIILNPASTVGTVLPIGAESRLNFSAGFIAPFQRGEVLTGGTSGATGVALAVKNGSSGTDQVWTGTETGTWTPGEIITGSLGGSGVMTTANDVAAPLAPAITGVNTELLAAVWAHNRRLWFTERNSLNAWYLAIDSIGGTATKFPLTGVFQKGGVLLFGQTFSSDSGAGMDDRCVFVTTEGEAAVYGFSPDLTSVELQGVYFIGRPLSKRAWYKVGGDLVTLTELGAVSLATAVANGPEGLAQVSSTAPIIPFWQDFVASAPGTHRWACVINPRDQSLIISVPRSGDTLEYRCLVANIVTGAWTIYTGWDCGALALLNGRVYMGCSSRRTIALLGAGGTDMGAAYWGVCVPRFQEASNGLGHKSLVSGRVHYRAPTRRAVRLYGMADQRLSNMTRPPTDIAQTGALWDVATWDDGFLWGGALTRYSGTSQWQAIGGQGSQISVGVIIGNETASPPELDIMALEALYEPGALL